ncbi:MauE/DoxX family redox-associated membrane protein [Streptomyces chrestomyceticus]|uniref:MauE/DoxX family redox-associated membrane protein n=1 Tax=Streptomyces chrestomyceticus TaxID=68185 RepID=UPI0019D10D30|nr:MauE/DoxX family redox-associated membrane protein [Streptomyces chrestomyceticus]
MLYVAIGMRCLLGIVFLVSSLSKTAGRGRFSAFAASVRAMDVVPAGHVRTVAATVVAAEYAAWMLLVLAPAPGFALAGGLLVAFTAAVTGALRRGVYAPCQCFGTSVRPLGRGHVLRNALLALGAAVGATAELLPAAAGSPQPAGVAAAVLVGMCAAGVLVLLDDLLELFRPLRTGRPREPRRAARLPVR